MLFETKMIPLKNGKTAIFRSPEIGDAAEMVDYLKTTAAETPFLMNYPEENATTVEQALDYPPSRIVMVVGREHYIIAIGVMC